MEESQIRTLLSEFDYNKNTLPDTLEFIILMSLYITRLINKEE